MTPPKNVENNTVSGSNELPARPSNSPIYSVSSEGQLPKDMYVGTDSQHFREWNRQLHDKLKNDPEYADAMEAQYPGINEHVTPGPRGGMNDTSPPGVTWHHDPHNSGSGQLVPRDHHKASGEVQKSLHPNNKGGKANWGGGRKRPDRPIKKEKDEEK